MAVYLMNCELKINLRHLWMAEIFVDNNTLHKHSVFHLPANLTLDFDQLKVDISSLEIRNRQDCIDCNFSHLMVTLVNAATKHTEILELHLR